MFLQILLIMSFFCVYNFFTYHIFKKISKIIKVIKGKLFMFDESVHNILKRKNQRFVVCVSACIFVFTILRMLATRFYIDPDVHFYTDNTNIFIASFDYAVAACVVLIYVISFFVYKRKRENHKYNEIVDCFVQGTQTQVFSASLTGFLFVAISVFQVYYFINPGYAVSLPLSERLSDYIQTYPFDFLLFFVSILSSVYFFKTAALNFDIGENIAPSENAENEAEKISPSQKYSSAHIIFSFMPIIWAFLNIFKCFFDMSKSVNSPVRIYELMSFLALSAYFVSEARMVVGRLETSRFFTFAYIAVIIVSVSALPNLIWSAFWILKTNNDQIIYAAEISLVVYILSRVYSLIRYGRFLLQR